MSDPINDGGPAFAAAGFGPFPNGEMVYGQEGMTLCDWFAGQVLAGEITGWSHPDCSADFAKPGNAISIAKRVYLMADAMIAERNERTVAP